MLKTFMNAARFLAPESPNLFPATQYRLF